VVTGLGFLGGGVIIKDKFGVKGLSTASTLWICAAIGLACGSGFVLEAIISTAVTVMALILLRLLLNYIDSHSPAVMIRFKKGYPIIENVRSFSESNGMPLKKIKILKYDDDGTLARVSFAFTTDKNLLLYFCEQLEMQEEIVSAAIARRKDKRVR